MTDHGGAASPRTEAVLTLRSGDVVLLRKLEADLRRNPWMGPVAIGFAEAAQEAPAPEGLRDEALLAADAVQAHHNGDTGHDPNDGCWPRLYRALGALPSLTWRAEARPPEGLDWLPSVDDLAAALTVIYPAAVANDAAGFPRDDAVRLREALAARLSAGGATKPKGGRRCSSHLAAAGIRVAGGGLTPTGGLSC